MYKRLADNQGTKIMTVSHVDSPDENVEIEGQVVVGRSKNLEGTGIVLKHDHKVSREHCRLDVGPLVTLVTDLGSSKGTRIESKSGKKITAEVLLPGQVRRRGDASARVSREDLGLSSRVSRRRSSWAATCSHTTSAGRSERRRPRRHRRPRRSLASSQGSRRLSMPRSTR